VKRFSGKVAAVTGGASGIGEAVVRLLGEEGARVAFADMDAERGRLVGDELRAAGIEAVFTEAHMEREAEAAAFVRDAAARFGRLDVLVNNAGMRLYQTVLEASESSWDAILGVNLKGYAFCAKAAIPEMRRGGGGSIVNIASVRAAVAGGNMVQYDATKAAVIGLTRGLAYDHAADGIRVNAVCPGPVFTRFHERRAAAVGKTPEEFKQGFGRGTMLKRPGTPREIATCIAFLASDDASYVTASTFFVDGGQSAIDPDSLTPWLQTARL
jgi:NAD(P)-dependent dehydrogenase (short-subunit alcohol dehydrogenase family)